MNLAGRYSAPMGRGSGAAGGGRDQPPVGFDRGFYLRGTPLWIDAERRARLCVLSALQGRLPPRHDRAVASLAVAEMLRRAGYGGHVLPSPCGRWVGLGGLRVMLWDTGGPTSGVGVVIEQHGVRLLAMGMPTRQCTALPPADVLAVRAPALLGAGDSLAAVADGLADFVDGVEAVGGRGVILVDLVDVGIVLHKTLLEAGVSVRAVGPLGKMVGPQTRRPGRRRKCRVTLALGSVRSPAAAAVAVVDSGSGAPWLCLPWVAQRAQRLSLRWLVGVGELSQMVAQTNARQVLLASVSADACETVSRLLGGRCEVRFAGPAEQLSLPARAGRAARSSPWPAGQAPGTKLRP